MELLRMLMGKRRLESEDRETKMSIETELQEKMPQEPRNGK